MFTKRIDAAVNRAVTAAEERMRAEFREVMEDAKRYIDDKDSKTRTWIAKLQKTIERKSADNA